jgi:hypothetical protein
LHLKLQPVNPLNTQAFRNSSYIPLAAAKATAQMTIVKKRAEAYTWFIARFFVSNLREAQSQWQGI